MTALQSLLTALALTLASPVGAAPATAAPAAASAPARASAKAPSKPVRPAPKSAVPLSDVSRMTPRERRCYGRIHQPAASVLLNRTTAPRAICVQSCEAKLIAPRREGGRIAALTLYTGRACRLPPGVREAPPTEVARARPPSRPR